MSKSILIRALFSTLTLSPRRPFVWTMARSAPWLVQLGLRIEKHEFVSDRKSALPLADGVCPALFRLLWTSLVALGHLLWLFSGSGRRSRLAGLELVLLPGLLPGLGLRVVFIQTVLLLL